MEKRGKSIKLEINLTNKWLYSIIAFVFILILGAGVWAYSQSIPNPGHGADNILVSVNGKEMNLQQAINQGKFGSSGDYLTECRICVRHVSNNDGWSADGDKECSDWSSGGSEKFTGWSGPAGYGATTHLTGAWIECR